MTITQMINKANPRIIFILQKKFFLKITVITNVKLELISSLDN